MMSLLIPERFCPPPPPVHAAWSTTTYGNFGPAGCIWSICSYPWHCMRHQMVAEWPVRTAEVSGYILPEMYRVHPSCIVCIIFLMYRVHPAYAFFASFSCIVCVLLMYSLHPSSVSRIDEMYHVLTNVCVALICHRRSVLRVCRVYSCWKLKSITTKPGLQLMKICIFPNVTKKAFSIQEQKHGIMSHIW